MNSKKIMIIIIIVLIIVIILVGVYLHMLKTKKSEENNQENNIIEDQGEVYLDPDIGIVESATKSEYYIINKHIGDFLKAFSDKNSTTAYELLDKSYAEEKGINKDNIIEKLNLSNNYQGYETTDLYYLDLTEKEKVYLVYGKIKEQDSTEKSFEAIMNIDYENITFSVIPYEEGTLNKDSLDIEKMTKEFKKIDKNNSNKFLIYSNINKIEYLRIGRCLNQYVSELNVKNSRYYSYDENNQYKMIVTDKEINQNMYNMLSENYIKQNSINENNVRNFVYKIEESSFYIPVKIYEKMDVNNIKTYAVYGVIESIDYKNPIESYLILNIDVANKTFSVEQLAGKTDLEKLEVKEVKSIENKNYNVFTDVASNIEIETIKAYSSNYKKLALGAPEIAYNNFLDEEYRTKRFGNVENYKKYIESNKEKLIGFNIQRYEASEEKGYTSYMGIDQNNKYYFFNATPDSNYKVILDYYTVDVPQFVKEYEAKKKEEKVAFNINKCIDAINDSDYGYMYSKLDETFKKNNYPTQEKFEEEMKKILFEKNTATEASCTEENENLYSCETIIVNAKDKSKTKEITFIMQLGEGTDFVMSFSVE